MEPHSAAPHKRCIPWQGVLLAVSFFIFRSPVITAQLTIESVPTHAVQGEDVLLLVHNLPESPVFYYWYRSGSTEYSNRIGIYVVSSQTTKPGDANSGRETIYSNASLLLRNVTLGDAGPYTLEVADVDANSNISTGHIFVYLNLSKPNIITNNSNPKEDMDSVTLMCELELQAQNVSFLWLKNSERLPDHGRLELSQNNRTLTIHNVTRNDTGQYQCRAWNPVSVADSDPLHLDVLYGPDTPTISPSGSDYPEGATLNLTCQAASNPPAQYSWLINGNNEQDTQNLTIPNINMTDSGNYTCQAYNNATNLTRTVSVLIIVSESLTAPSIRISNTTITANEGPVVLTCLTEHTNISIEWVFNGQRLQYSDRMMLSQNKSVLTINPVKTEDTGNYQCEVFNNASSRRSDPITLTVNKSSENPGLPPGAIAGIVIGVLAGVALIAALVYFLCIRKSRGVLGALSLIAPPQCIWAKIKACERVEIFTSGLRPLWLYSCPFSGTNIADKL
ncbi:PREDICTED: carcinoembryonic antigen-related cell adhesion molecule 1-like [Elephantulus edwardii]|uniref:carcinoembryonic antigen-related cell adhesion molecule 1-like n=1 Tax=Elephantulus edwardii TaxID=28737 RepID=UPI0003F0907C|nr:PREDICTED: carcinoembryonic antigen-related cell adhesion molecule 1-like [Elephantulus edwardii]